VHNAANTSTRVLYRKSRLFLFSETQWSKQPVNVLIPVDTSFCHEGDNICDAGPMLLLSIHLAVDGSAAASFVVSKL